MMRLSTTVYTAYRGYSWANVPGEISETELDALYRMASAARTEFPTELDVDRGLVANGFMAAAFTIRNVPQWDSEGRPAEYAAFALFPCMVGASIDLVALLAMDFFAQPTREVPRNLEYDGPVSRPPAIDVPGRLLCRHRLEGFDAHAAGALLASCGGRSDKWIVRLGEGAELAEVETGGWKLRG